jgi:hypothetical protein
MDVEIAVPHVPASLVPGTPTRVPIELHNSSGAAVSLRLSVAGGRVSDWAVVEPATADLPPGGHRTVEVVFQIPAGAPVESALLPFTVWLAGAGDDARMGSATGLVRVSGHVAVDGGGAGQQAVSGPAVGAAPGRTRAVAAVAVIATVLAVVLLVAWFRPEWFPFLDRAVAPAASGTAPAAVRRPYVMVDSYPQLDPADRTAADASLARLTAAGLPVRLVDSKTSDDIADGTNGFWVVLRDGFASADEANAFCARYQSVTPRCEVVP